MIQDALDALGDVVSRPLRGAPAKSVVLSVAPLALGGFALDRIAVAHVADGTGAFATLAAVAIGLGLGAALLWLAAPVTSLVSGLFLDELAAVVERGIEPFGPIGGPARLADTWLASLRFSALSAIVALAAPALPRLPGRGFAFWIAADAFVSGGEGLVRAASRFRLAATLSRLPPRDLSPGANP